MAKEKPISDLAYETLAESLIEATKEMSKEVGKAIVKDVLPEVVSAGVSAAGGVLGGVVVSACLKKLLSSSDKIERQLAKLVRAPYATGCQTIRHAFGLPPGDLRQERYRDELLKRGVAELQEAHELADDDATRNTILLLMGLCELEIEGGQLSAKSRLNQCADYFEKCAADARKSIERIEADLASAWFTGPGVSMMPYGKERVEIEARTMRNRLNDYESKETSCLKSAEFLRKL